MRTLSESVAAGIEMFRGKISRNLLVTPMQSNVYLLEQGDELVVFDSSCAVESIQRCVITFRQKRRKEKNGRERF